MGEREDVVGYTYKADCWSLGVILYLLLSGKHPFSQGEEMTKHIMEGKFRSMTGRVWDTVSSTAKCLVRALLETDPDRRLSTEQVLEHSWFGQDEGLCARARGVMEGGQVDMLGGTYRDSGVGVDTVKGGREVEVVDLTQDSEE